MPAKLSLRARLTTLWTGTVPAPAVYPSAGVSMAIGATGATCTTDTALRVGAVWRAVSLISSTVGKLPLNLYRREGDGKVLDRAAPLFPILRYHATPEISQLDFRQTMTAHVLLRGNAYAYILRDPVTFAVQELWPLSPDVTCAVRETDMATGASQVYYVTQINNQLYNLPAHEILHIRGLGSDGLTGYSVIRYFADDLSLTSGMRDYSAKFFKNGARPNVVLTHPGVLDADALERLRTSWANAHQGLDKAHGTAILEEGMQIKEMQINARDAQLLEARNYQIRDIANWFSVPPHKLGDNSRTAYNSIEAENQSFLDECLDAWLVRFELEMRNKLLTEEQKRTDSHVIEFHRSSLLRSDMAARSAFYTSAVGGPWMTRNEARSAENMNDIEGGDKLLEPMNMAGGATAPEPAKETIISTPQQARGNVEVKNNSKREYNPSQPRDEDGKWPDGSGSIFSIDQILGESQEHLIDNGDAYGFRIIPDDMPTKPGDILRPSTKWVDGTKTDEELPGTSTIGINLNKPKQAYVDATSAGYPGKHIALVSGNSEGSGEDIGEKIISSAKVLKVWKIK